MLSLFWKTTVTIVSSGEKMLMGGNARARTSHNDDTMLAILVVIYDTRDLRPGERLGAGKQAGCQQAGGCRGREQLIH